MTSTAPIGVFDSGVAGAAEMACLATGGARGGCCVCGDDARAFADAVSVQ